MKKLLIIPIIALFIACESRPKDASQIKLDRFRDKISYALGADIGANFQNIPEDIMAAFNIEELEKGFAENLKSNIGIPEDCEAILRMVFSGPEGIDTSTFSMAEVSNCYGYVLGDMLYKSLDTKEARKQVDYDIVQIGFSQALRNTDTLIDVYERQQMIIDFNNDLNKVLGEEFMEQKMAEHAKDVQDEGYILIVNNEGDGEAIDLTKEYEIVYTLTNIKGDTIISTIMDPSLPVEQNAQLVQADDVVFPEVWKIAASKMTVGGDYTIYTDYELGFGEEGLRSPSSNNYVIQPFASLAIHSRVLSQGEPFEKIKRDGLKRIEAAKKERNAVVDPSGFVLITHENGNGKQVPVGGDVQAHYILKNALGEVVEDSHQSSAMTGRPAPTFSLNSVIKGWQLGIPKMQVGGKYTLVLPHDLAYGEAGNSGIQPYETLTFELEIINAGESGELIGENQQQQLTEEQLRQLQEQFQNQ